MKGKFLGLPRERSERPEARQVFRSKWVRAKVNISPKILLEIGTILFFDWIACVCFVLIRLENFL